MTDAIGQNTSNIAQRQADILGRPPHPTEHTAIMVRNSALYRQPRRAGAQLYRGALPILVGQHLGVA